MNLQNFDFSQIFTLETLSIIVRLLIIIFIGFPILYMIRKWAKRYFTKRVSAQQGMIISKIVYYIGLFILLVPILNEFGFKLSHILGAAGIVGIALGFASQTSVSNVISGLFLIAERPFQVNDVITIQNITGVVLSIDTLSVKIRTFDNKYVRIPNETIIKSEVTNITHFPIRRVDLKIGIAYKEDIERVRDLLLDIARKNPVCLNEPEPLVIFSGFGSSSIDLLFVAWATKEDWLSLNNKLAVEIKRRFDEEGIEIPFPHISLYTGSRTESMPIKLDQGN
ncbi:mechanosensitive ion channel family protein [candidate division KSB1 bacterium]|nr:mechanosensitive ion channel family protein [candidate division KSB1 bacterium]